MPHAGLEVVVTVGPGRFAVIAKLVCWLVLVGCSLEALRGQSLAPRAYFITPLNANAVTVTWSFNNGGVDFNGTVPITSATGTYHTSVFSYYHSFSFFGRSANFTGFLPYSVGTFQGSGLGTQKQIYRSGLMDTAFRFSVNLKGGPAMPVQEFVTWKQKILLGASLIVVAPTGQYSPTKLINWSIHRWAFKPEFGYSQRWDKWVLDGSAGAWFYTTNTASFSIPQPEPQSERPVGSFECHLSRDYKAQRLWASLDGNFWSGGTTRLNGILNPATKQTSSRIGATASFPVSKHQSIKASYSTTIYESFGGKYKTVSVAWQYSWLGDRRKFW